MRFNIKYIIISIAVVIVVAIGSAAALFYSNQTTDESPADAEIVQLEATADSESQRGQALLEQGDNDGALSAFRSALEKYQEADRRQQGEAAETAPSPQVVDMLAQIALIESLPPPALEPQQAEEDFPVVDTEAEVENPGFFPAPPSDGVIVQPTPES